MRLDGGVKHANFTTLQSCATIVLKSQTIRTMHSLPSSVQGECVTVGTSVVGKNLASVLNTTAAYWSLKAHDCC